MSVKNAKTTYFISLALANEPLLGFVFELGALDAHPGRGLADEL
jgi:hypothetical protein